MLWSWTAKPTNFGSLFRLFSDIPAASDPCVCSFLIRLLRLVTFANHSTSVNDESVMWFSPNTLEKNKKTLKILETFCELIVFSSEAADLKWWKSYKKMDATIFALTTCDLIEKREVTFCAVFFQTHVSSLVLNTVINWWKYMLRFAYILANTQIKRKNLPRSRHTNWQIGDSQLTLGVGKGQNFPQTLKKNRAVGLRLNSTYSSSSPIWRHLSNLWKFAINQMVTQPNAKSKFCTMFVGINEAISRQKKTIVWLGNIFIQLPLSCLEWFWSIFTIA